MNTSEDERPFVRFLGLVWDPHRLIYATLILMVALAIYEESTEPFSQETIGDVIAVVLAPLFALAMAHAFSDALDIQVRTGRRLSRADRRRLLNDGVQYLAVGVPVIALAVIDVFVGSSGVFVIDVSQALGVGSLFFWGAFAARRAGLDRWAQLRFAFIYGFLGLLVIVVELLLTH